MARPKSPETDVKIRKMVDFVRNYQTKNRVTPSLVEIAGHLGVRESYVSRLLVKAVDAGLAAHRYGSRRNIEVLV